MALSWCRQRPIPTGLKKLTVVVVTRKLAVVTAHRDICCTGIFPHFEVPNADSTAQVYPLNIDGIAYEYREGNKLTVSITELTKMSLDFACVNFIRHYGAFKCNVLATF